MVNHVEQQMLPAFDAPVVTTKRTKKRKAEKEDEEAIALVK